MQVYVFTTDDTDPVITLTSPTNETVQLSGTTIDLSISDTNLDTVEYKWDSGSWISFPDPYDTTLPAGDGTHTLYVNATDAAGNWVVHVFLFTTDGTDPVITLTSPASETVHQSGTTIDLSITDVNGITQVLYSWDGQSNSTLNSPYDVTLPGGEGTHTLHIYARDPAGNWVSATFMFTTDDTGPTIGLVSPEEGSISPAGTQILLKLNDTHMIAQAVYNWDGNANTTISPPYDAITDILLPATPGAHVLRIYVQDQIGNWASVTYVFTTETPTTSTSTPPTTPPTSTTQPTAQGDFFTVEVFLLALVALSIVLWYRKKRKPEA
ncbi:MAG: Ig-like domain-containing protein [Promethearchaeota archaeon]